MPVTLLPAWMLKIPFEANEETIGILIFFVLFLWLYVCVFVYRFEDYFKFRTVFSKLSEGIFSREPFGQCKFLNIATFYSSDALNSQGQDMKIYVCVFVCECIEINRTTLEAAQLFFRWAFLYIALSK